MGYEVYRYPLGAEKILGFTMKHNGVHVIFTNTCSPFVREVFTLAHEIGHIVLHGEVPEPGWDDATSISEDSEDEMEQEANYFAESLLMPADEIAKFLDLEVTGFEEHGIRVLDMARMMAAFQVSFETLLNRLEKLKKLTHSARVILDNESNQLKIEHLLRSAGKDSRLNKACKELSIPSEYLDYAIYNYNHNAMTLNTLERVLTCYDLTAEDISDELITPTEEEEDLDELIGGLTD